VEKCNSSQLADCIQVRTAIIYAVQCSAVLFLSYKGRRTAQEGDFPAAMVMGSSQEYPKNKLRKVHSSILFEFRVFFFTNYTYALLHSCTYYFFFTNFIKIATKSILQTRWCCCYTHVHSVSQTLTRAVCTYVTAILDRRTTLSELSPYSLLSSAKSSRHSFFTRTTSTGRDEQTRKNKNKINQPVHNEVMYCTNADDDGSDGELYCGRDSEPRQLVENSKPDFHRRFTWYSQHTSTSRERERETNTRDREREREREKTKTMYVHLQRNRALSSCTLVPSAGDCRERDDGRRHRQRAAKRRARGRRLLEAAALGVVVDGPGEFQRLAALPHHYLLPPHPVLLCLEARLILFASPPPLGPGGLLEERHDGARRQGRRERLPRARAPVQPPSRPRQLPRARAHQRRHRLRKARSHCPRPRSSSPPFYLYSTVPCSLMASFSVRLLSPFRGYL
jgi:hypothetical protein